MAAGRPLSPGLPSAQNANPKDAPVPDWVVATPNALDWPRMVGPDSRRNQAGRRTFRCLRSCRSAGDPARRRSHLSEKQALHQKPI